MLKDVNWSENRVYRTHDKHEPVEFYLKALASSTSFDLLLGYFSTSAINVLSLGFASFIHNGGTVRIVANHILSKQDKEVILAADSGDFDSSIIDLRDIKSLVSNLDEYGNHFFNCISYLIANKRIELVLVSPKEGYGIAHFKSGAFHDGTDTIGFKASCNFTYSGLMRNLEELEVFLLWENSRSSKLIASDAEYFENLFSGNAQYVDYIDCLDIEVAIQDGFKGKSIDELLVDEEMLLKAKRGLQKNVYLKEVIEEQQSVIYSIRNTPKFPYASGPRDYQIEAYENWIKNNKKGIFAMATGTGKTITSLNCLYNQYLEKGTYQAVILVPTISLVEQWEEECFKFNFNKVIKVSSKAPWTDELSEIQTSALFLDPSFIIIATYASFPRSKFQYFFKNIDKDTVLIADEAHNFGAPSLARLMDGIHLEQRIGLSATIDRKYDDIGNNLIQKFFDSKPPYTYEYSMKTALENGVLCQYTYTPHIVYLNDKEQEKYLEITKQLYRFLDSDTGKYRDCQEVTDLLMRRKRVIHKASNKKTVFKRIVREELQTRGNLKYTLVYAPEGINYDYSIDDEIEEEESIINEYSRIITDLDEFVTLKQFTGGTKNRDELLKRFSDADIDVLISMKCLDEGVDVPRSELAFFCASTGNPRQFIQRRGRVLRKHDDKSHATIHDLIVLPKRDAIENQEAIKGLVKSEMARVYDFSSLAINSHESFRILEDELDFYNVDIYNLNEEE